MVYARLASGYRPGGPNSNAALGVPAQYGPDRTQNYEVGVKGAALDGLLSFDASVYHIDWKDLIITLREPRIGASYKANAGEAKSEGVDLSVEVRPASGLTLSAWGAWNAAELSAAFPATSTVRGADGERLPFSSRFSSNISAEQEFGLTDRLAGFVGGDVSYVGNRLGIFTASGVREVFPSYTKVDLRAGVRADSWSATFYANNVGDKRGVINGGAGNLYPNTYAYIQPRTVGVNLSKSF
jgi:iron complex outermembrane receptor protein